MSIAKNIMVHLTNVRDSLEKQRAINFNLCLADFINPAHKFREQTQRGRLPRTPDHSESHGPVTGSSLANSYVETEGKIYTAEDRGRMTSFDLAERTPDSSPSPPSKDVTQMDHQRIYDRAAALLWQSLELCLGGGVVFFDVPAASERSDIGSAEDEEKPEGPSKSDAPPLSTLPLETSQQSEPVPVPTRRASTTAATIVAKEKVVLAAASITAPYNRSICYGRADTTFRTAMLPSEVQKLCRRHPDGKLFNISRYIRRYPSGLKGRPCIRRNPSKLAEIEVLRAQFPTARQAVLIPMVNTSIPNRWTVCIAYTTSPHRVFTHDTDYLHILSFCNAVQAKSACLATMFADQQKGAFIGAVSHELRSPLHGIVAAIELLKDTDCTAFQKSCIDTADACGQTLLDTVNMVLDVGQVDTLKSEPALKGQGRRRSSASPGRASEELSANDNSACDLALVIEEVVEGITISHTAKHGSNIGCDGVQDSDNHMLEGTTMRPDLKRILCVARLGTEVVLDIQAAPDWTYLTQPGSFRRIVMNLLINALQYTQQGYISVGLSVSAEPTLKPMVEGAAKFRIRITIADTGQGMSSEYLRTKVFAPFARENDNTAETGLGLSIVHSVVSALGGEINIKSVLNVGTIVTVILPMKKASNDTASHVTNTSDHRSRDPTIVSLRHMLDPPKTAIYEPILEHDSIAQTKGAASIHKTLAQYISGWFGFPDLQTWSCEPAAKILFIDEIHLPTMLAQRPDFLDEAFHNDSDQIIIILCANPARQAILDKGIRSNAVQFLCKPFGPHKLARTIARALAKTDRSIVLHEEPRGAPAGLTAMDLESSSAGGFAYPNELPPRDTDTVPLTGPPQALHKPGDLPAPKVSFASASTFDSPRKATPDFFRTLTGPPHPRRLEDGLSTEAMSSAGAGAIINAESFKGLRERHRPRVLLVDDNKLNLQLLYIYILKRGFSPDAVHQAYDGLQAFNIFESLAATDLAPDVVFMDVAMPVCDGYDSTRQIRRFEKKSRECSATTGGSGEQKTECNPALIVALTGNAGAADKSEAFVAGVDLYMTKPVSLKEVGRLLDNWREYRRNS